MNLFIIIYSFIFGLLVGSFANVVIFRLPAGRSVVRPRSACGSCGRSLTAIDLVPVFSWLFLAGKCRTCKAPISIRYPLVELAMGLGFAGLAIAFPVFDYGLRTLVPLCILFAILFIAAMIDFDTLILPDVLTIPALIFALLASFAYHPASGLPNWLEALQGAGVAAGVIALINRVAGLVLRRFADTKERLFLGMDQINLAALGGALGGWWLGFALAAASLLLNRVTKKIWRLPEGIIYALWLAALLFAINSNPWLSLNIALRDSCLAAGWVTIVALSYWWLVELRMDDAQKAAYERELENDPAAEEPVAMGLGDTKLMGVLGAMLGVQASLVAILIAVIVGAVIGVVGRIFGGDRVIPFGPSLVIGGMIALLAAKPLIAWYLHLLGI